MQDMKQRVEHASKALEKMASENASLRKQLQQMDKQKLEIEADQQKKFVESMQDFRLREAKLKTKCKKYQKLKNDTLEALKTQQNYQV